MFIFLTLSVKLHLILNTPYNFYKPYNPTNRLRDPRKISSLKLEKLKVLTESSFKYESLRAPKERFQ